MFAFFLHVYYDYSSVGTITPLENVYFSLADVVSTWKVTGAQSARAVNVCASSRSSSAVSSVPATTTTTISSPLFSEEKQEQQGALFLFLDYRSSSSGSSTNNISTSTFTFTTTTNTERLRRWRKSTSPLQSPVHLLNNLKAERGYSPRSCSSSFVINTYIPFYICVSPWLCGPVICMDSSFYFLCFICHSSYKKVDG